MKIKSIDLWTEQYCNHYECFNGAFVDDLIVQKFRLMNIRLLKIVIVLLLLVKVIYILVINIRP